MDHVQEAINYVDFNPNTTFDDACFMDTDHLNERGAHIFSGMLAEMFGW